MYVNNSYISWVKGFAIRFASFTDEPNYEIAVQIHEWSIFSDHFDHFDDFRVH